MANSSFRVPQFLPLCAGLVFAMTIAIAPLPARDAAHRAGAAQDAASWTPQETVEPAALVKELSRPPSRRPTVVCVGFRTLYEGAHVPGASFHGPAMNAENLADLKKWAQRLPRSTDLVIYCGCCPLAHCPNVRPAFQALQHMGFTRLRLLLLPHDFAQDWVELGYPVAKGK